MVAFLSALKRQRKCERRLMCNPIVLSKWLIINELHIIILGCQIC